MLLARATNGIFYLGLDAENIKRLQEGKPIVKALSQFGGTDDVVIMYGETYDDLKKDLEAINNGNPLPAAEVLPDPH